MQYEPGSNTQSQHKELTLCPTSSILYSSSVSYPLFVYYKLPWAVVTYAKDAYFNGQVLWKFGIWCIFEILWLTWYHYHTESILMHLLGWSDYYGCGKCGGNHKYWAKVGVLDRNSHISLEGALKDRVVGGD